VKPHQVAVLAGQDGTVFEAVAGEGAGRPAEGAGEIPAGGDVLITHVAVFIAYGRFEINQLNGDVPQRDTLDYVN